MAVALAPIKKTTTSMGHQYMTANVRFEDNTELKKIVTDLSAKLMDDILECINRTTAAGTAMCNSTSDVTNLRVQMATTVVTCGVMALCEAIRRGTELELSERQGVLLFLAMHEKTERLHRGEAVSATMPDMIGLINRLNKAISKDLEAME